MARIGLAAQLLVENFPEHLKLDIAGLSDRE
jgi:hypothetical protein